MSLWSENKELSRMGCAIIDKTSKKSNTTWSCFEKKQKSICIFLKNSISPLKLILVQLIMNFKTNNKSKA